MSQDSLSIERVLLGACLLEDEADTELVCSLIEPRHFYLDSHQRIFAHICDLSSAREPVNTVTLMQELITHKELASVGGAAYLTDMTSGIPHSLGERLRNYAERLREFWRLRELAGLGERMALEAGLDDSVASSIIQSTSTRLEAIVSDSGDEDSAISSSIVQTMDRFHTERVLQDSPGLSFGLPCLDRQTGGMMPGFQTAAGAISGVGKTTFMCQAIHAALIQNHPVDAFLLEPTKDQVTLRLISLMSGVQYSAVVRPWTCRGDDAQRLTEAAGKLAELPLRLHDRASMTLDEVLGLARLGINRYGTRLICLDYIQRLKIRQAERDEAVRLRVGRASTALADLVKGTNCHSLLLSQINTGRRSGAQAVPTMFDFRESSQIENDAATIVLLHRDYDEAQGHFGCTGAIFVPKQRFGTPCNIKAWFDPYTASWRDTEPGKVI